MDQKKLKKPKKKDIEEGKYRNWWSKDRKKWYIELDNKFDPLIPRVFILTPKWKKDKHLGLGKIFSEGTFKRKMSTKKDVKEYMRKLRKKLRVKK